MHAAARGAKANHYQHFLIYSTTFPPAIAPAPNRVPGAPGPKLRPNGPTGSRERTHALGIAAGRPGARNAAAGGKERGAARAAAKSPLGEGNPLLLRGLRKIATVPAGFRTIHKKPPGPVPTAAQVERPMGTVPAVLLLLHQNSREENGRRENFIAARPARNREGLTPPHGSRMDGYYCWSSPSFRR